MRWNARLRWLRTEAPLLVAIMDEETLFNFDTSGWAVIRRQLCEEEIAMAKRAAASSETASSSEQHLLA